MNATYYSVPRRSFHSLIMTVGILLVASCSAAIVVAQTDEAFGDSAADPVRLFERAQSAHARGELERALDLYEQAIKVKPEFPEAEFQRGNALVALSRLAEAELAFRRAIALKKNWSLPYSALGALLMRNGKDLEAEEMFRQALVIDARDNAALRLSAELRLRAGDKTAALAFARRAAADPEAPSTARVILAVAERANGDKQAAKTTLDAIIVDEPANVAALLERADLNTDEKNFGQAIIDLKAALKSRPNDKTIMARMAYVYQENGQLEEAQSVAKAAGLEVQASNGGGGQIRVIGSPAEIADANSEDPAKARKALEALLEKNPRNAMLLAKLGASYRTDDPRRSMEYYRRAAEIDPRSSEYALGYAAALVQSRDFALAARLLRQVVKNAPENYAAHANLATALYELKDYSSAIPEYEWLLSKKPEVVVAHYFIATAHDYLGEYPEALASYETFLGGADPKLNQLEIEKVKLRLPTLRRQIELKEGVKKKPSS